MTRCAPRFPTRVHGKEEPHELDRDGRKDDNLMADLKELSERLLTQETTDSVREAENLERWLITHIQSEDQALAEYLKQKEDKA